MLVLAHDAVALVWILACLLVPPLVLAWIGAPVWSIMVVAPVSVLLLALPLAGLWRRVTVQPGGEWPRDLRGRHLGSLVDAAGLNQRKNGAELTGVPDSGTGHVIRVVGRNAKCPCGSGKKFKYCCGIRGWRHVARRLGRSVAR